MLGKENIMHLLVQQDITSFEGFSKVMPTTNEELPSEEECRRVIGIINDECYDIIINSNSHIISIIAPYISNHTIIIGTSHSVRYTESDTAAFNSQYIDRVIALSGFNKKYLDKTFNLATENKCTMVSNFVAYDNNADAIRETKKKSQKISIVYAGGGAPTKSPELIVKVIRQLLKTNLDFQFTWLGITTPPLKKIQPFQSMGVLFPNDPRVNFLGQVNREDAARIIAEANIFFAPSRREGCPMSLLEAMRIGTIPIVADYDIANKEIIRDGENGFVINHLDVSAFVSRITEIITNHEQYGKIYDESYQTFCSELSYDVWKTKMDDVINSSKSKHTERLTDFDNNKYQDDVRRFKKMHNRNIRHMMLHETIPSALSCLMLYLSYHKKK